MTETDLLRFFNAEYINGFGFQAGGLDNQSLLIIAQVCAIQGSSYPRKEIQSLLRQLTQSKTVTREEWLGREFIAIDYREWELIPIVFQTLINMGNLYVTPHCKLNCSFKSGEQFSWAAMERKSIAQFREQISYCGAEAAFRITGHSAFKKYYNWRTEAGKIFCAELRRLLHCKEVPKKASHFEWPKFDETCRKYHVMHRGIWSAYEPSQKDIKKILLTYTENDLAPTLNPVTAQQQVLLVASKKRKVGEKEEEEDTCMICLDKRPNTLVFPCMHCVVCSDCSVKLSQTNDSKICVQCRVKITAIAEDEKELITIQ